MLTLHLDLCTHNACLQNSPSFWVNKPADSFIRVSFSLLFHYFKSVSSHNPLLWIVCTKRWMTWTTWWPNVESVKKTSWLSQLWLNDILHGHWFGMVSIALHSLVGLFKCITAGQQAPSKCSIPMPINSSCIS